MSLKIRAIKSFDSLVGHLFLRFFPDKKGNYRPEFSSILFIRPGGIGDAVLLLPVIKILRRRFPNSTIDVLSEKRNVGVFQLSSEINKIFVYDRFKDLFHIIRSRYDIVVDTEQWHRLSAVIARLATDNGIIGYATNERSKVIGHPTDYSHDVYETDNFIRLLAPLGITSPEKFDTPFIGIGPSIRRRAEELLGAFLDRPFIALFPGASIPERRWGAKNFRFVAEALQQKGVPTVVVGGKEDAVTAESIIFGNLGLNLAGKTSLAESAAVIDRSSLLLSGDSGVLHIGVGLGKPTVSLFGPGIAKKWAPRGKNHIVINKNLPCSPCTRFGYTPKCPIGSKCMKEISVDEVFTAVLTLLDKNWDRKVS